MTCALVVAAAVLPLLVGSTFAPTRCIDTHVHLTTLPLSAYTFPNAFPSLAKQWHAKDFYAAVAQSTAEASSALAKGGALLMQLGKVNCSDVNVHLKEAQSCQAIADACPPRFKLGAATATTAAESAAAAAVAETGGARSNNPCAPIVGFVAGAPLELPSSAALLSTMNRTLPALRGIREAVWHREDAWIESVAFVSGVRQLAKFNLPFDVLLRAPQLAVVTKLVSAVPTVRFNVNHLAYPPSPTSAEFKVWCDGMHALARYPNAFAKLSGLPQSTNSTFPAWRDPSIFLSAVRCTLDAFGSKRVNFAGNWFVETLFGSYAEMWEVVVDGVLQSPELGLSDDEIEDVMWRTANELYRLGLED